MRRGKKKKQEEEPKVESSTHVSVDHVVRVGDLRISKRGRSDGSALPWVASTGFGCARVGAEDLRRAADRMEELEGSALPLVHATDVVMDGNDVVVTVPGGAAPPGAYELRLVRKR